MIEFWCVMLGVGLGYFLCRFTIQREGPIMVTRAMYNKFYGLYDPTCEYCGQPLSFWADKCEHCGAANDGERKE